MPTFAFYKYKLPLTPQQQTFDFGEKGPSECNNNPDDIFSNYFNTNDTLELRDAFRNKNRSYDNEHSTATYKCDILAKRDNIIVLSIENNKSKNTIIDRIKISHDHHPFCYVIIDCNNHFLALHRSTAFDNDLDKLRFLFVHAISNLFYDDGFGIELDELHCPIDDIWDAINQIRTRGKDRVKKISLEFHDNRNSSPNDSSEYIRILTEISKRAQAKGMFSLEAEDNKELDIDAIHEDLINIANICLEQQQYDLVVYFQSYGMYRYGANVIAQFGVDEKVITNFVHAADETDLFGEGTLTHWLNQMQNLFSDYVPESFVARPTKQGNRR